MPSSCWRLHSLHALCVSCAITPCAHGAAIFAAAWVVPEIVPLLVRPSRAAAARRAVPRDVGRAVRSGSARARVDSPDVLAGGDDGSFWDRGHGRRPGNSQCLEPADPDGGPPPLLQEAAAPGAVRLLPEPCCGFGLLSPVHARSRSQSPAHAFRTRGCLA